MKKTLFASAIVMAMLGGTVSFAESPLAEKFASLSEQIIEQAERPFDKLEELKALFTSCAEKNSLSEVKSACAEWLSSNYPKIKVATPQQIYVELGSGDVEVKFIRSKQEPAYGSGETVDIYQVDIPKYNFSYQFSLVKATAKKPLSERERSQNGNIVIPNSQYGHTEASTISPSEVIALYATPHLSGDSSLQEVGREYKKVYQDAFQFTDWGNYYQGYLKNFDSLPDSEEFASFPKTTQDLINKRISYLVHEGELPKFLDEDNQHQDFFTGNVDALYGRYRRNQDHYCSFREAHKEFGRKPKPGCRELLKEKYKFIGARLYVVWNKNNPKYIWVTSDNGMSTRESQFIVK